MLLVTPMRNDKGIWSVRIGLPGESVGTECLITVDNDDGVMEFHLKFRQAVVGISLYVDARIAVCVGLAGRVEQ